MSTNNPITFIIKSALSFLLSLASIMPSYCQTISQDSLIKWNKETKSLIDKNIVEAYKHAYKNYQLLESGDYDKATQGEVYATLSTVYNGLTDYPLAIQFSLKSINMFEDSKQTESLVKGYNSLGGIYYNAFNFERTILFTKKAIEIAQKNKLNKQLPLLYNNLSGAYRQQKKFIEAFTCAFKGLEISSLNSDVNNATLLATIGEIHFDKKQYDSAFIYFNKSLNYSNSLGISNSLSETSLLSYLAKTYYAVDELNTALKIGKRSYNMARSAGLIVYERELSQLFYNIYSELNKTDSATYFKEKYIDLEKQIWNVTKERQMSNVVIKTRERELQEKNLEVNQQRWLLLAGIVFLIGFVAYVVLLLIVNKKRKKLYQTIQAQHNEINEKNKELEAYHLVKDKIFSTVVHDFKTPLNSLEGILSLLEQQELSKEHLSELASQLKVNLAASKQSVNNLIFWAKNQMTGIEPTYELIDLTKLLGKLEKYHELSLKQKELHLKIDLDPNTFFYTDEEIISIVLNNLLSNAIKFSPREGCIIIKCSIANKKLTINLADQGPGIAPEELKQIFSIKRITKQGSGIGLAVSKELLEKINGTISIDSRLNEGSRFTMEITSALKE